MTGVVATLHVRPRLCSVWTGKLNHFSSPAWSLKINKLKCSIKAPPSLLNLRLKHCRSIARKWFGLFWEIDDWLFCFQLQQEVNAFLANSGQENQLRLFSSQWPSPSGNIFNTNYVKYFYECFAGEGLLENDGSAIRKCWAISRSCWAVCLGNSPRLQTPASLDLWLLGLRRGEARWVRQNETHGYHRQVKMSWSCRPSVTPCNGNLIEWLQKMRNQ